MGNRTKDKSNTRRKLPVSALIAYLLIAVVLTSGVTLSRYATSISGSDGARVAEFDVASNGIQEATIQLGDMKPGDVKTYSFTVTNSSEVAVQWSITLTSTENLPLTYELTLAGGSATALTPGTPVEMSISPPNDNAAKSYTLTVTWPSSVRDAKYSGLVDAVKLIVIAEQVD